MIKLTREEIYKLVWEKPMTDIAKRYLISDVGFRKLCKRLNIPVPKAGYWAKIQAGQILQQPALPGGWQGKKHAELRERLPEQPVRQVSELDILVKQIAKERLPFKVPDRLSMPDPLIVAAKGSLGKLTDLRYPGMMVTAKGQLDIRVSKSNISRALRFMDTLVKLVRARGYRYEVNEEGNFVVIGKIKLRVNFVNGSTAYDLVRCRKNHAAFIKIIITLTIPELTTQLAYKGYFVKRGYIAHWQPAQVDPFFPGVQQSDEWVSRPWYLQHSVYLSDRFQFNNFWCIGFHNLR